MEEQGIYLFRRNWVYGGCVDWNVQATETQINALKNHELEHDGARVASIDVELLDRDAIPSHAFDSTGQLWCKVKIDII